MALALNSAVQHDNKITDLRIGTTLPSVQRDPSEGEGMRKWR
jgi:hypothetical protein